MKTSSVVLPALLLSAAIAAQAQGQMNPPAKPPATASTAAPAPSSAGMPAPTKIGLINLRDAIAKTADGQKAVVDLEDKFASRKSALQRRSIDLQAKQDQLSRGGATMSDAAKSTLSKDLESDTKNFKRDVEDLNTDAEEEQNKAFTAVWTKMQPVLQQYAMQNGLAVILDVGNDQSPVLWASNTVFIQDDVVSLYNQSHPSSAAAPQKPAAPAPPPAKKQ